MKRQILRLAVLLAAASLVLAAKPGGGSGSSLSGRFYVFTGKPVYSAVGAYGARAIPGSRVLKLDGSVDSQAISCCR